MSNKSQISTAYVKQTDQGVKNTAGWRYLGVTANTLNVKANLIQSDIVTPDRLEEEGTVISGTIEGDIESEFQPWKFDTFIEGAFMSSFTANTVNPNSGKNKVLTIEKEKRHFSFSKNFDDVNVFTYFYDCMISSLNIEVTTDAITKIKFGLKGLGFESQADTAIITNINDSVAKEKASTKSLGVISIDGEPVPSCVSKFSLSIDNNQEIQRCLGSDKLYGGNINAGIAKIEGSITVAFNKEVYEIWKNTLDGGKIGIEFPIIFDEDNVEYRFKIAEAQIEGDLPSPEKSGYAEVDLKFTAVNKGIVLERNGLS